MISDIASNTVCLINIQTSVLKLKNKGPFILTYFGTHTQRLSLHCV